MLGYLKHRRILKSAREALRHARHLLNMRGDVMPAADRQNLTMAMSGVEAAIRKGRGAADEANRAVDGLYQIVQALTPRRTFPGLRENVEVVVVAVAVAMGFRSYFLQPFKIPTGSMEPTLYGIHASDDGEPEFMDRFPVKYVKWIVTGEMHHVVRVRAAGHLNGPESCGQNDPTNVRYFVGPHGYRVPRNATLNYAVGTPVPAGAVLWAGTITAGDHVFVNKILWNFRRPQRGEVMVFATRGIADLQQDTHYIKRLVGLPGETVSIAPPNLLINGREVHEPAAIERVASRSPGYAGYTLAAGAAVLAGQNDALVLSSDEFFALGDNTQNSRDGRYWGAVPAVNLVGPATTIYWPLTRLRILR